MDGQIYCDFLYKPLGDLPALTTKVFKNWRAHLNKKKEKKQLSYNEENDLFSWL